MSFHVIPWFMFRFCWNSFQSFHRLRGNCETKKNMEIVSWELQSRRLDVFWCCCLASSSVNGEVKRKLEDTPTHLAIQKKVTWNELHYFGTWWFHDFIAVHLISSLPSMSFSMPTSMYSWPQVSATFIWVKSQRSACEGKRQCQWDMFPTQSRYLSLDLGVKNAMHENHAYHGYWCHMTAIIFRTLRCTRLDLKTWLRDTTRHKDRLHRLYNLTVFVKTVKISEVTWIIHVIHVKIHVSSFSFLMFSSLLSVSILAFQ